MDYIGNHHHTGSFTMELYGDSDIDVLLNDYPVVALLNSKYWRQIPDEVKMSRSLNVFKNRLKSGNYFGD